MGAWNEHIILQTEILKVQIGIAFSTECQQIVRRLRQWTDWLQIGGKKIGEKYVDQSLAQVEKMSVSTQNSPPDLQGTSV